MTALCATKMRLCCLEFRRHTALLPSANATVGAVTDMHALLCMSIDEGATVAGTQCVGELAAWNFLLLQRMVLDL